MITIDYYKGNRIRIRMGELANILSEKHSKNRATSKLYQDNEG